MNVSSIGTLNWQLVEVPHYDRWLIYQRLQELCIPCQFDEHGQLRADIQTLPMALQLRSVVQQWQSSRSELIGWLNRCWDVPSPQG